MQTELKQEILKNRLMEAVGKGRGGARRRLNKGGGERDFLFCNRISNIFNVCNTNIQTNANRYERGNIGIQANGSSR